VEINNGRLEDKINGKLYCPDYQCLVYSSIYALLVLEGLIGLVIDVVHQGYAHIVYADHGLPLLTLE
jgi:hypothetical protein